MKHIIFLFAATVMYNIAIAQKTTTKNGTPTVERFGFVLGYFGDRFTNHGYSLGFENYLATTENFNIVGSLHFTNYFAEQNFTAVTLSPKIGLRYTTNIGLFVENNLGLGYMHRFFRFNQFEVNAQGQIISNSKASQASVMPSIVVGTGYDFRRKTKLPMIYFLRTSVNFNYPNKHFIFEASYALETGFIYIPKIERRQPKNDNASR